MYELWASVYGLFASALDGVYDTSHDILDLCRSSQCSTRLVFSWKRGDVFKASSQWSMGCSFGGRPLKSRHGSPGPYPPLEGLINIVLAVRIMELTTDALDR